ncbi:MAG TPA: DUF4393 domain-containing protein [Chitinophagales bacterium]|nr:DUF4393 domain-containing protein [Chitinophagales bacterium]HNL05596.1 DUF4393 domain-containing protein [Bacteroidia bacterium]HNN27230.1 DUF4393 domain-containing protein [Chitinophagales bacterium]
MDEKTKINALVNLGQPKIVEKAYDDLLSEPSKKAGSALGTIINVGNTILWPIKWVNERTRLYFENNLKKYEKKLNEIPEENIVEVPTEISMPILERFTYTSNEELSNAFVNLLTSASSSETINTAHPGFIQIIDRLAPDEAILIKYLSKVKAIPIFSLKFHYNPNNRSEFRWIIKDETGLDNKVEGLKFKDNVGIYLNNLISLGIIERQDYWYTSIEDLYEEIENGYSDIIKEGVKDYPEPEKIKYAKSVEKEMYILTQYGNLFVKACIEKKKTDENNV